MGYVNPLSGCHVEIFDGRRMIPAAPRADASAYVSAVLASRPQPLRGTFTVSRPRTHPDTHARGEG